MKTAISVPDETFAKVETHAAALGMSRSEFFTRAARRYIEQLEAETLTGRINMALDVAWPDDTATVAVDHGRRRLALDDDQW